MSGETTEGSFSVPLVVCTDRGPFFVMGIGEFVDFLVRCDFDSFFICDFGVGKF